MDNDEDIPSGITNPPAVQDLPLDQEIPEKELQTEIKQTNIINGNIVRGSDSKVLRTESNFRHRTSREGSRSKDKPKNKAVSEHFELKHQPKNEQIVVKKLSKDVNKPVEVISLPPAHPKSSIKKREEIKEVHQKSHQFNRKEYHKEQIVKDLQKNPIKYKIMCDVYGCKPEVAFEMPKQEASYIQEGYMKQKGMEYLREGNSRARYNYIRDKRLHTQSSSKLHKSHSTQTKTIKGRSSSHKILKLSAKQALEGKLVYEKVRKHIKDGQRTHDYFRHLTSEQSIDEALVKFLKTKIKRAEMVIK